jgi:hypothetical protein
VKGICYNFVYFFYSLTLLLSLFYPLTFYALPNVVSFPVSMLVLIAVSVNSGSALSVRFIWMAGCVFRWVLLGCSLTMGSLTISKMFSMFKFFFWRWEARVRDSSPKRDSVLMNRLCLFVEVEDAYIFGYILLVGLSVCDLDNEGCFVPFSFIILMIMLVCTS